jgi:hypothetical protein
MAKLLFLNKVIFYSKSLMAGSFLVFAGCLLISYPYAQYFSLPLQVSAHIFTIIFAAIFKVAVVSLMAAKKELLSCSAIINSIGIEV